MVRASTHPTENCRPNAVGKRPTPLTISMTHEKLRFARSPTDAASILSEIVMNRSDVEKRVVKVVCQVLGVEPAQVKPESHFVYDLGAESTQSVELVAAFEHEFAMEMDEDAALEVQTVGAAVDFIAQNLS
jgi:acyl carrier protein